jgi:hypothetical protein
MNWVQSGEWKACNGKEHTSVPVEFKQWLSGLFFLDGLPLSRSLLLLLLH